MSFIAIVGGGPIGGALAHRLAGRDRVREVRLIDPEGHVAEVTALDITQSGPVEGFSTRVSGARDLAAAAGAEVIAIADAASGQEHAGEAGLALVRRLYDLDRDAPFVFAGASQRELMARVVTELKVPPARAIGAAPYALESALRALAGLVIDRSGVEISLRVVGVPPDNAVVAWEEAAASGQPLAADAAPHQIAALGARIASLWPPGEYSLGSAAAQVIEAIVNGSRRRYSCFVAVRGVVVAMPVELGPGGLRRVIEPSLTPQERTRFENSVEL
jgi:malate dehydrogenase